jgi:hypothetical protein
MLRLNARDARASRPVGDIHVRERADRHVRVAARSARCKLLADAMLDNAALKELLGKKW